MRDSWHDVVDAVLRPARPQLASCLRERERHVAARQALSERRTRALADCRARIETARAVVFAANDGVISRRMTELEREWRKLARQDPDAGLMELWSRIAPAAWLDRKYWRGSEPAMQLDAAIALASDVDGVLEAEAALASLRAALMAWGIPTGAHVRWRMCALAADADCTTALLDAPLRAAEAALRGSEVHSAVLLRAGAREGEVHAAVRLPDRPLLARSIAHAAFVDIMLRAAALGERPDPVAPLRRLWSTGYVLASLDGFGAILEIGPLVPVATRM